MKAADLMKATYLVVIALLAAPAGAEEPQLSKDQQDACGAILCLAGGTGVAECAPYLKRFFDITQIVDRKNFLNKCPDSGLSQGAITLLATHGQTCQPPKLVNYLNLQICGKEQKEMGFPCREPRADDWQTLCGTFYAELTTDAPPKLVERCRDESDGTGALERNCHHRWVANDYEAGSWCKSGESCEETVVGADTGSSADSTGKQAGIE